MVYFLFCNADRCVEKRGKYLPNRQTIENICEVCGITQTEFYSDIDRDSLAAEEILLIEYFKKVPEEDRKQILEIVKTFVKK